jgi:predicted dithiol-disulfide oxidoreductase (DUF899 family)
MAKEKELTRFRDQLAAERRAPWVKVEKQYRLRRAAGQGDAGRSVRRTQPALRQDFTMGPGQAGQCVGCSLEVDHIEGALVHLHNHDVSYAVVARAPVEEIEAAAGDTTSRAALAPFISQRRFEHHHPGHIDVTGS